MDHRFDTHDLPRRGERGAAVLCTCGRRFAASNGEFAHQALERHAATELLARSLHPASA